MFTPRIAHHVPQNIALNAQITILEAYKKLKTQTNVSPDNILVKNEFDALYTFLRDAPDVTSDPSLTEALKELPKIYAKMEALVEVEKAKKWLSKKDSAEELHKTIFQGTDYINLWASEAKLMLNLPQKFMFLGSGAIPFTAMAVANQYPNLEITCLDCDPVACDLSQQIIQKVNLQNNIKVACTIAQHWVYSPKEVIFCASLIEGKEELYDHLYHQNVQRFMVRHTTGARQFLYAPAPEPNIQHYTEIERTPQTNDYFHITRLFERCV